jgi:hypothetical protein
MKKGSIEKFSLKVIAAAVSREDLPMVRAALSGMIGAMLDVSGKVQKVVKREGQEKLVIEPGDVPGFVVFADFRGELEMLRKVKVRKGSPVTICGKFVSFGASAVCVNECKLDKVGLQKKGKAASSCSTKKTTQSDTHKKGKRDKCDT